LPAIAALARAADGSLRDGLSLLDQALAYGNGTVRTDEVLAMLGTIDRSALATLAEGLMNGDRDSIKRDLLHIAALSVDYSQLLSELLVLWHDVAARQVLGDDVESELVDDAVLVRLAEGLTPEDVQLYYQLSLLARRDIDLAPDHRTGFEMAMLRLLAFRTMPVDATAAEIPSAPKSVAASNRVASAAPAPATRPNMAVPVQPAQARVAAPPPPTVANMASAPATAQGVDPPSSAASEWFALIGRAQLRGPSRELAAQLKPISGEGARWKLALAPNLDSLNSPFARKGLEDGLGALLGDAVSLEIVSKLQDGETMAERSSRARSEHVALAEKDLLADSGLQALTREFGARVVPGSLQVD